MPRKRGGDKWGQPGAPGSAEEALRQSQARLVSRGQPPEQGAEQALLEGDQRLRLALEAAKAWTWDWDLRTHETTWPDGLLALLGLDPGSRVPSVQAWREAIHPDDRERVERAVAEAVLASSELAVEWRIQLLGGPTRWLAARGQPVRDERGATVRYMGIVLDVTATKRAEEALRESERKFYALYDHAPFAIALIRSPEGTFAAVNDAWERMMGYSRAEVLGKTGEELNLSYDLRERARMYAEIQARGSVRDYELEYLTRSGGRRLGSYSIELVDIGGRKYYIGSSVDITDRKKAEAALRRSEERFRALIEKSTEMIAVVDAAGRYQFWSQGAAEMLGWSSAEKVGRLALETVHPDDQARAAEVQAALLTRPEATAREVVRCRHRDGSWRELEVTIRNLVGDPAVEGLVLNGRDVTAQRRLEEQLRQSQKLESVGRLAGGVAHDFNNLLTVILSCAESLDEAVAAGRLASLEEIHEVRTAGRRASELTRQLLAFARKQLVSPVLLDVGTVVRESQKMLARLLGEDVRLEVDLAPDLWTVSADPGQVAQVIVNLAVNARDAMPRGGTLLLGTRNLPAAEEPDLAGLEGRPGDWVRLLIRDTGTGMSEEVRAHVFEPFFTTKEQGKGTGLGLATVHGIVQQAGGLVRIRSRAGQGTDIEVFFPRVEGAPAAAERGAEPGATRGSERVLLVEDDPQVRAVTVRALQAAGYAVRSATQPQEALDLPAEELRSLQLLITDVVMPGLDGRALAEELRRRRPGLRVLFLSGYTPDAIAARGVLDPGLNLLPKPFTGPTLLARVRSVLDS